MKDSNQSNYQSDHDHAHHQKTESYLRAINHFVVQMIEITTVEELVWHVASEVVGKLDFVDCVVYLLDKDRDMLVQPAAIGEKSPEKYVTVNRLEIPVGTAITGTVARTLKPMIIGDTSEDQRYLPDMESMPSEICVPLIYDDQLLGVIDSEHPEKNYFDESHLEVLSTIAAITSAKIAQCRTISRTRAQARVIQQVTESVFLIKEGGLITACNEGAAALHDMSKDELVGSNLRDLLYDDDDWFPLVHDSMTGLESEGHWKGRVRYKGKDSREVMTEVSVTKIIDGDNDADYISVTRDISDQIEFERSNRELHQALKMESLGHLTGGIAHDFNNLLGIISGYSELVLQKAHTIGEDRIAYHVNHVLEATRRATNLVSQMLTFSRSDDLVKVPVNLENFLLDEFQMIRATLPSSIELHTEIEHDLPNVLIDQTQLHQILINLALNSRDAMDGSGDLTFKLGWVRNMDTVSPVSHKPIKGDFLALCVSDTGTGIDESLIEKIFNPFFTTKDVGKGTGMGLSVVYNIMEEHEGHILIDSIPGRGTTFHLLFVPLPEGEACNIDDKPALDAPRGDGAHILVVDDEESLCDLMSYTIQEHGYMSTCVPDSRDVLELLENNPDKYSLLLTDQTMPKMTGIELITKLREIKPDLPAIICSGFSDKIDANLARGLNITYTEKPVDMKQVLRTIGELLSAN